MCRPSIINECPETSIGAGVYLSQYFASKALNNIGEKTAEEYEPYTQQQQQQQQQQPERSVPSSSSRGCSRRPHSFNSAMCNLNYTNLSNRRSYELTRPAAAAASRVCRSLELPLLDNAHLAECAVERRTQSFTAGSSSRLLCGRPASSHTMHSFPEYNWQPAPAMQQQQQQQWCADMGLCAKTPPAAVSAATIPTTRVPAYQAAYGSSLYTSSALLGSTSNGSNGGHSTPLSTIDEEVCITASIWLDQSQQQQQLLQQYHQQQHHHHHCHQHQQEQQHHHQQQQQEHVSMLSAEVEDYVKMEQINARLEQLLLVKAELTGTQIALCNNLAASKVNGSHQITASLDNSHLGAAAAAAAAARPAITAANRLLQQGAPAAAAASTAIPTAAAELAAHTTDSYLPQMARHAAAAAAAAGGLAISEDTMSAYLHRHLQQQLSHQDCMSAVQQRLQCGVMSHEAQCKLLQLLEIQKAQMELQDELLQMLPGGTGRLCKLSFAAT